MGLFGNNRSSGIRRPSITKSDQEWVETNFRWMLRTYGYPKCKTQYLFTTDHFLQTCSSDLLTVDAIIDDLSCLLSLDRQRINYQFAEDIRDVDCIPYMMQGMPFESELVIDKHEGTPTYYKVIIAKSLLKNPGRLIYCLILECLKIRLDMDRVKYDPEADKGLFVYLVGIYFGFGVILTKNLVDIGTSSDGLWSRRWVYKSIMTYQIMAYALALFSWINKEESPEWADALASECREEFRLSMVFINERTDDFLELIKIDNETMAKIIYRESFEQYKSGDIQNAISNLQKIIFLTENVNLKSDALNNIGYYMQRLDQYAESIPYFMQAIDMKPQSGYANDNLGLSLIMTGEPEEGREYLEKAVQTGKNDNSYSDRNKAIYWMVMNDNEQSEKYFLKVIGENKSVDLLHYFYAKLLLKKGNKLKAIAHLKIASGKGEHEAKALLDELLK